MRKKVDSRIRTLVERCVALRHRSLFVIVGDKGRDQARRQPPDAYSGTHHACLHGMPTRGKWRWFGVCGLVACEGSTDRLPEPLHTAD